MCRVTGSLLPVHGWAFLLFLSFTTGSFQAQVCQSNLDLGFTNISGDINASANCDGIFRCYTPTTYDVEYRVRPVGCDPAVEECTIRAVKPMEFRGNHNNTTSIGFIDSPVKLRWTYPAGAFAGSCGHIGARITTDRGEAWIQRPFRCGVSSGGNVYNLRVTVCDEVSDCEKVRHTTVDLTAPTITQAVCPPPPEKNDCDDCTCESTGAGPGSGAAPPFGGGASSGGAATGPGTVWFYKAGGIGRPNQVGSDLWDGRYWSHSYGQRIFQDADPDIVHLITERAVYRTYTDTDSDDTYDEVDPASEYRKLEKTVNGWTLTDLDGSITLFNTAGRWLSTTDRHGNAKIATYSGSELQSVAMPDGRREDFTYLSGKIHTITEVGVDGSTFRTWTYTWTGQDLTRIDRPDGTALAYLYDDPKHPGYLTRITLIGLDDVSERITAAFEYDSQGNTVRMWRGDVDFANGVDQWQFAFDNPVLPTATTITDPLGNTFTRTWADRDWVTDKARLASVNGDCPTCGLGPNTQLLYEDPANPFRPTRETDGNGNVTLLTYDSQGRMTSRTEAVGEPEERTTDWQYDPTYPALVTRIERPSTTGDPMDLRIQDFTRDASGNVTDETLEGVENDDAFSFTTVRTFTSEGLVETINPPGHSSDDLVTYVYDPLRGSLILDGRIDPIVGTTDFGYDPFNRQISVVDPNGIETETEYDAANRVTFVRRKGAIEAEDLVTENRYNTFGDLFQTVLPEGNVIEYSYDVAGRLTTLERKPDDQPSTHGERTVYTLDGVGNRVLEKLERWESGVWIEHAQTAYTYSTRCYLDQVTSGSAGEQSVTEYAYDCNGNLSDIWDANHPSLGQTEPPSTEYAYDPLDRLVEVRQPFGGARGGDVVTGYQYDVQDHLTRVTDGEGTVTEYEYSDRDLLTREISEVSGISSTTYTASGELDTKTDARGIAETRSYDALDRLTTIDYLDDTLDIAYIYDDPAVDFSLGRLTEIARDGHAIAYEYDRFGRITRDGELTPGYDKNSNRVTLGYPGNIVATYTFDYADREATLSVDDGSGPQIVVSESSYLPSGPLDGLTLGNGFAETRSFDSRYYPDSILLNDGSNDVLWWNYTTDAVGNPTSIVDQLNASDNRTYGYQDYQYFLTQGDGPWGTLAWTYDKIGNRLTESRDGGTADVYSYLSNLAAGNSPRLDQITLDVGGVHDFSYDAIGDQTQADLAGNVIDRMYDDAGRMSRQERTAAAEASTDFLYDGRGFLRRSVGIQPYSAGQAVFCDGFESGDTSGWGTGGNTCMETLTTEPVYSSAGLLHHNGSSAVFYFAGRPVAQLDDSGLQFLTVDHLGTSVAMSTSAVDWAGGFEPFGADYAGASDGGVFLRFPGQWADGSWETSGEGAETLYNLHRWFVENTGGYTRKDPMMMPIRGPNPYSYAEQSPNLLIDPLGLLTCVMISGIKVAEFPWFNLYLADHASLFITGPCSGASPNCNSPAPFLYDPNGGYPQGFPDLGSSEYFTEDIEGWSLSDYFDYQCDQGGDVLELFCFQTTCCEEEQVRERVPGGGSPVLGCSLFTTLAVNGVGPFGALGSGATPNLLRRALNRAIRKSHRGTLTRLRCPRK